MHLTLVQRQQEQFAIVVTILIQLKIAKNPKTRSPLHFMNVPKLLGKSNLQVVLLSLFLIVTFWMLSGMVLSPAYALSKSYPSLEDRIVKVIQNRPELILESLQRYQQQQQEVQSQQFEAALDKVKNNPKSVIGQSPVLGDDAGIILIEFSDFQCPFCSKASEIVDEFMGKHKEVKLVYKHLPLDFHAEAMPAAKAAWAANQQGKFWPYHHQLFAQQDRLGEPLYKTIARDLNLDLTKFEIDRASVEAVNAIAEDINLAETLGISGTPFFVMGGEMLSGAVPLSDLENVLTSLKQRE